MWQFLKDGGPIMFLLIPTSVVGLTFIIERGLALRWKKVIPPEVEKARLALARSTQIVLANVLALLGLTAPDRM